MFHLPGSITCISHVANLPRDIDEAKLRALFGAYGAVTSVKIEMDKISGKPDGFAFVDMSDDEQAKAAIQGLREKNLPSTRWHSKKWMLLPPAKPAARGKPVAATRTTNRVERGAAKGAPTAQAAGSRPGRCDGADNAAANPEDGCFFVCWEVRVRVTVRCLE